METSLIITGQRTIHLAVVWLSLENFAYSLWSPDLSHQQFPTKAPHKTNIVLLLLLKKKYLKPILAASSFFIQENYISQSVLPAYKPSYLKRRGRRIDQNHRTGASQSKGLKPLLSLHPHLDFEISVLAGHRSQSVPVKITFLLH